MRNIKLLITYDGTRYAGWQRQKNAPTIQEAIEEKLALLTRKPVTLHGAGRTDSGVHALGMVAHFLTPSEIPAHGFVGGLNSMLAADIRILSAMEVPLEFHSRYHATGKTYLYYLFTGKILLPHRRYYRAHVRTNFDPDLVNICLETLIGSHDFSSFETAGSRDITRKTGRGAVRTLHNASCQPVGAREKDTWLFSLTGDGFLRHMVRALVGTLIRVGNKKISPDDFTTILLAKDRGKAFPTAPACGLFLKQVYYNK